MVKGFGKKFDLTFIGGGISCTKTLIHLLEGLADKGPRGSLSVLVIEKTSNIWTGIAYGSRSSNKALTITTLGEFLHPLEKKDFLEWVLARKEDIIMEMLSSKVQGEEWVKDNEKYMNAQDLEHVYFPRFLYGRFLKEKLNTHLENEGIKSTLNLQVIQSEVVNIYKINNYYSLNLKNPAGQIQNIDSEKIIFSMGHIERKMVPTNFTGKPFGYFPDPYFPTMDQNLCLIPEKVVKTYSKPKNILLIGSNASALELLYLLNQDIDIIQETDKIFLLSASGEVPAPIEENHTIKFPFPALQKLMQLERVLAEDLIKAIRLDFQNFKNLGLNLGGIYYPLSEKVISVLQKLDIDQRKIFHDVYGMEFTRLIRRAGPDYSRTISSLKKKKKLEIEKGNLVLLENREDQYGNHFEMIYEKEGVQMKHPQSFRFVFNCTGFRSLNESENPLIRNIIQKDICRLNGSLRGFEVNDQLEGNQNLHILGPLLGSLFIPSYQYWHVENSKRIHELSLKLSTILLEWIEEKSREERSMEELELNS